MRKERVTLTPGQMVKELRTKKEWTQAVLSKITGIAVSHISAIEHDKSRLGEDRAILIAHALGVKPEFLLFPNGYQRRNLVAKLAKITERKEALASQNI